LSGVVDRRIIFTKRLGRQCIPSAVLYVVDGISRNVSLIDSLCRLMRVTLTNHEQVVLEARDKNQHVKLTTTGRDDVVGTREYYRI